MNLQPKPSYPINALEKVLIEGVKEIVGLEGARELFSRSRKLASLKDGTSMPMLVNLQKALNERYGLLGGQGLALRSGRATFKHGLTIWGKNAGVTDNSFRLLPFNRRILSGLEKIGALLTDHCDSLVQVSEDQRRWIMRIQDCPACDEKSEHPACYLVIGVLQEYMAWAAGGRFFNVRETACLSAGADACVFQIEKAPLE